jgi:hypothetical protein
MSHYAPEIIDLIQRGYLDDDAKPMPGIREVWNGTEVTLIPTKNWKPKNKPNKSPTQQLAKQIPDASRDEPS